MSGITKKQKAILHIAKARLCLDDDTYRDALRAHAGVASARDMDPAGFRAVMDHFARCGFTGWRATYPSGGERPGMATPAQIRKIYAAWWALGGTYYTPGSERRTLRAFLRKRFRVDHENFLTFRQAWGVIEAIKRISGEAKGGRRRR